MRIGCDPEFVYYNLSNKRFVPANEITYTNADLGSDGHSATGEMRPSAQSNAKELVVQIASLFNDAEQHDRYKKYGILAGHYKYDKTIGGHIHLSGFGMDMQEFNQILDMYFCPLSDLIDPIAERSQRQRGGYGSGYRSQGANWIEYRRPGSWLLSPLISYVNLGLAELIAHEYAGGMMTTPHSYIVPNVASKKRDFLLKTIAGAVAFEDKELLGACLEKVFSLCPIDWSQNIKENWIEGGISFA